MEALFNELVKSDWPQGLDTATFMETKSAIERHTSEMKSEVENAIKQPSNLLSFIDHYVHHTNWKFRVCAVIFLSVLIDEDRWRRFNQGAGIWWNPIWDQLEERFWGMLSDPEPRVLEYLARSMHKEPHRWIDFDTWSFPSLPINKPQLHAIDLDLLLEIDPKLRPEIFWAVVCLVAERVRRGEGSPLKPLIRQLVEIALQEGFSIWTYSLEESNGGYILELLRLLWRIPPLHVTLQLGTVALDLVFRIGKEARWYGVGGDATIYEVIQPYEELLGRIIAQLQSIDLLHRFFNDYEENTEPSKPFVERISHIIEMWLSIALKAHWDEAAQFLLTYAVELTSRAYQNLFWEDSLAEVIFPRSLVKLLEQYLSAEMPCTLLLLENLSEFYNSSLDSLVEFFNRFAEYRKWPFPQLQTVLVSLGQSLEQQKNSPLLDYCLTTQLLPVLQGAITSGIASDNQAWIFQIMGSLLEHYIPLWHQDQLPMDPSTFFDEEGYVSAESDETIHRSLHRNWYLQLLSELVVETSEHPSLWGRIVQHLYTTHGIWILRWLVDILLYTVYTSENWFPSMEAIGMLWKQAAISLKTPPSQEDSESAWLAMILQGCAAVPSAQVPLIQNAVTPTIPLHYRKLFLAIQIRYGAQAVDSLIPLEQWYPKPLREMATSALGVIQDPRAVPTLLDTMRDESPGLRARCAWALGEVQDLRALAPLLALLEDTNPEVRTETIRALGKLGDSQAIHPLLAVWEALKSQKTEIEAHRIHGIVLGWQADRVITWLNTVEAVQEALRKLGIYIPPIDT